jgi:predicted RNase H-like nuclease (RuvC/YqgF family)
MDYETKIKCYKIIITKCKDRINSLEKENTNLKDRLTTCNRVLFDENTNLQSKLKNLEKENTNLKNHRSSLTTCNRVLFNENINLQSKLRMSETKIDNLLTELYSGPYKPKMRKVIILGDLMEGNKKIVKRNDEDELDTWFKTTLGGTPF